MLAFGQEWETEVSLHGNSDEALPPLAFAAAICTYHSAHQMTRPCSMPKRRALSTSRDDHERLATRRHTSDFGMKGQPVWVVEHSGCSCWSNSQFLSLSQVFSISCAVGGDYLRWVPRLLVALRYWNRLEASMHLRQYSPQRPTKFC